MLDERNIDLIALGREVFVNGSWSQEGATGSLLVDNPATGEVISETPDGGAGMAEAALAAARAAAPGWAMTPAIERGRAVQALAKAVRDNAETYARIITAEQGKPIGQARGEVAACAEFLSHAASGARRISGDIVASDNRNEEIHIRRHPYGVVVALTAWNYPAALAGRKAGPALVAGNTLVLMSHELTPLSGLFLARLAEQVGLPAGVFNVVTGRGPTLGAALVSSPETDLVTMTGSLRAGRDIYAAGAADLKVLRLELGGKAPFIVMEDADIDAAVDAAVAARFTNCGQICTCNERMYLHRAIADSFLERFVAKTRALTMDDPMQNPDLGPKISAVEVDKVAAMVAVGRAAGDEVLLAGGPRHDGAFAQGHWYAPTVLESRDAQSPLLRDEIFGPVISALRVDGFDEAVALANASRFGLSAYLFTEDRHRLMRAPAALKFGELYLNRSNGEQVQGFHTGWRHSGLGGEDGAYGFDGYFRKQTAYSTWA